MNQRPVQLTSQHVIAQGDQQVSTMVEGDVVLMNVADGSYFKLDDISTQIWGMIAQPCSVRLICDRLAEEFSVDRERCEADVLALLNEMAEHSLIRVV